MTNYKEIDGKLFRMLAEPVPLTPDAEMPCLVKYKSVFYDCLCTLVVPKYDFSDKVMVCINIKDGIANTSMTNIFPYSEHEIIGTYCPEGSHDWAKYMAEQRAKLVFNINLRRPPYYYYVSDGDGEWYAMHDNKAHGINIEKIFEKYPSGWQIYEPEPEPAYKVGDWVKDNDNQHYRVAEVDGDAFRIDTDDYDWFSAETGWYIPDGQTRGWKIVGKVKPSEVNVKITLEGQVTKPMDNTGGRFWLYYSTDEYVSVELDALDTQTRELVEDLLKAQEDTNG